MQPGQRYLIVTPCRNEAGSARVTLDSVINQTVPPAKWIVVDDGSTDDTGRILDDYAARHDFIEIVHRPDRGKRSVGRGVVEAFYAGLERADISEFDYICKLDLDLDLPPRYFEILLRRMHDSPRLGTCSGKPYYVGKGGALTSEGVGDDVSVGASKFYRRECFEQIGGFVRGVMWDGIDCHRCRMLGWTACSWDDPELRFVHLRPMGSSDKSIWVGRRRHGYGQYFMGTGLLYMTASAFHRTTWPPLVVGGLAMWIGYVSSLLRRLPRYEDKEFRRFLRRYHLDCLLRGKHRAMASLHDRRSDAWKSRNT